MVRRWTVRYPAVTGWEKRHAYIYLPKDYDKHPDRRYPVLYMFDGQNLFWDKDATYKKSWGLARYLDRTHTPLIVAALECNTDPQNARLSEYCPFDWEDPKYGSFEGHGEDTMNWFMYRFKPMIDRHYRTLGDREHTFIGGSSMGGLMSLYAVTAHNNFYSRALAFSPTLDADPNLLAGIIDGAEIAAGTVVYMDYGFREFDYEPFQPENFAGIAGLLFEKEILLSTRIVPEGDHSEASWERQLPFAIPTLMYGLSR